VTDMSSAKKRTEVPAREWLLAVNASLTYTATNTEAAYDAL